MKHPAALLFVLVLVVGCGGRSPIRGQDDSGAAAFCAGSPAARFNGVDFATNTIRSIPGPPMSCCRSAGLVFAGLQNGKPVELRVLFIENVGSGSPPPTSLDLADLRGWRVHVSYYPCSTTSAGCAAADSVTSEADNFSGSALFKGQRSTQTTLDLCLSAGRGEISARPIQSVQLYARSFPLTWF